ncbi:TPA: hypothetical protein ACSVPQ_003617 [Clostridioides difficile]|nr:hypothetical protein [Clostridioides difficile]MCW0773965.1 hypothetical protein [Clostridioides difficile]MCW0914747.1 hypothetical protein [Clostridioides difficile]MDI2978154.1 hypothetical protein [Clostridioides difficile]MDI6151097.1 hypothetical protein [Clostridioides difficile]MDI7827548.1 hypothetical protein [Clostridioides difficile]
MTDSKQEIENLFKIIANEKGISEEDVKKKYLKQLNLLKIIQT